MCSSAASSRPPERAGRWLRALTLLLSAAAAGCAAGPDFKRPPPPSVDRYVAAGQPLSPREDGALAADWWRLYQCPALDAVVAQALHGNQTIASGVEHLRQSQDALRAGYGVFLPAIGADVGASRERLSPLRFGQAGPATIFNLFTAAGTISYLVDVFGGSRRQVEELRSEVDYQKATADATYLTVTGNVVTTTIALAGYRAQLASGRALVDYAREQLALDEARVSAGIDPYSTVLAARGTLAAARDALASLELRAQQAEHLQALLAGKAPADWTTPEIRLESITLPRDVPLSLPSELVRRRPDILAAEARLHAASADIGIATAALFPQLTLSASGGRDALTWSALSKSGGEFWSAGADLNIPVLEGGQAWYRRSQALDAYRAAAADYRQTVLAALQQVADALQALDRDEQAYRADSDAAEAAREGARLAAANYSAGTIDYLALLGAQAANENAQLNLVATSTLRLQDSVALIAALGGGWRLDPAGRASPDAAGAPRP